MAPTAVIGDGEAVRAADREVERIQAQLVRMFRQAGEPDPGRLREFVATAPTWATALNDAVPDTLPPHALAEIRGLIIEALGLLQGPTLEQRPADALEGVLVKLEAVRHILRDQLDGALEADEADAKAVLGRLEEWLPGVAQSEIAQLVHVTPRTLQRWRRDGGATPRRLLLVTRLAALLHQSWTPAGVLAWFHRARPELDGSRPIDLLEDPRSEAVLLDAARRGRAGHGA
ncbi:MAG: hypothetical protein AB1416_07480 [Actinomycetota bacterium]